jgi:molybdate transport system regulatory protein
MPDSEEMEIQKEILKQKEKLGYGIKFWLTFGEKSILGAGWSKLLKLIDNKKINSLTQAAKEAGYSYKYAWNILKRIEKRTGISPVITRKGGKGGGGSVRLSDWGRFLLKKYTHLSKEISDLKKRLTI